MYENELYHHGIKGMRWGVRRYQNEDAIRTKTVAIRELDGKDTGWVST